MTSQRPEAKRESGGSRLHRAARALRIVHPVPSLIVAGAVAVLTLVGGASATEIGLLTVAMFGFQGSIGALNDLVDADADVGGATSKPIALGIVSRRSAAVIAAVGAAVGILGSAAFGPVVVALGLAGWGCGATYDVVLRRWGLGWAAFAFALPLLLLWAWTATRSFPDGWPTLLLVAAVAGPMVHLANGLVDPETDVRTGRRTLATALGPWRSRITLGLLAILVLSVTLLTSPVRGPMAAVGRAGLFAGAALALAGVGLAWSASRGKREVGWLLLAIGLIPIAAASIVR